MLLPRHDGHVADGVAGSRRVPVASPESSPVRPWAARGGKAVACGGRGSSAHHVPLLPGPGAQGVVVGGRGSGSDSPRSRGSLKGFWGPAGRWKGHQPVSCGVKRWECGRGSGLGEGQSAYAWRVSGELHRRVLCGAVHGTSGEEAGGEVRPGSTEHSAASHAQFGEGLGGPCRASLLTMVPTLPLVGFLPLMLSSPVAGAERDLRGVGPRE